MSKWDVIVIGGGAAGLWAAGSAAALGGRVLALEKNTKAGVKILISGGTRCNITHACDVRGVLDAFGSQSRFLKPALHALPPDEVVAEFNRCGVPTKVEDTGKVFPVSDRAIDVRDALVRRLSQSGATLQTGVAVRNLRRLDEDHWQVHCDDATFEARRVLLCCGGLSYPGCGTTGDGYAWAEQLGHTIQPTHPALTPLLSPASWVHQLSGLTLPDVRVSVLGANAECSRDAGGRKARAKDRSTARSLSRGGFLWTHFGCSGPTAMNVSGTITALERPHLARLAIDLAPDVDSKFLHESWTAPQLGRQNLASVLHGFVPKRMVACLLERAEVFGEMRMAELPMKARKTLIDDLKSLQVPLAGSRGYAKAEVTAGGVATAEVNSKTLESRKQPGLFLAGEILDVDGPIGGFNFQAAFSTGHLAAQHIIRSMAQ